MGPDNRLAFSPQETALVLGLCLNSVYKLIKQGRLKAVKIERKLLIPRTEIEALLHQSSPNIQTAPTNTKERIA